MRMLFAVATALLLAVPAGAQDGPKRPPAPQLRPNIPTYNIASRDFIFPSGLRVIMQADHSAPVIAVTTVYDRGSTADPVGKEGIAHFVEHLWFKSRHLKGSDVRTWDILSENGCALNASTSFDWTNYMTVCPKSSMRTLLKFASLRMTDPVKGVLASEVTSEREVIRNELRMRMENGGGEMMRYVVDRLFNEEHPYHRLTIGTHGSLDNISLEDIQDFTVENYRPEYTTIVVVGDFDIEDASSLIFENFAPEVLHPDLTESHMRWAPKPGVAVSDIDVSAPDPDKIIWYAVDPSNPSAPLPLLSDPPKRAETFGMPTPETAYNTEVGVYEAPVDANTAIVAWSLPGGYQGDWLTANVAAQRVSTFLQFGLADDRRFRLDPDTRQPNAQCFYWELKANSMIICSATIRAGQDGIQLTERMLDQLSPAFNMDQLSESTTRQIMEAQIQSQRTARLAETLASTDRVVGLNGARATDIAMYAHHTGHHSLFSHRIEQVSNFDTGAVLEFGRTWLTRKRAAAVVLNPIPPDQIVIDSSESDYHGAQTESDRVVSSMDPEDITEDLIRESVDVLDFDKVIDRTLDNGMRVVVVPHGEAPLMTAHVVARSSADAANTDLLADAYMAEDPAFRLAATSASNPSMVTRIDARKFAGTSYPLRTALSAGIGVTAPAGNVDQALWSLRERLEGRRVVASDRFLLVRELLRDHRRTVRSRRYWLSRITAEHFGADHPAFGQNIYTQEEYRGWRKARVGDLREYVAHKYAPSNLAVVIVGNFDAEAAFESASRYLGGYTRGGTSAEPIALPEPAPIIPREPRVLVFDDPDKPTQTQVSFMCRTADLAPEHDARRRVASKMISDHLFDELRAKEGVTYGAGGGVSDFAGTGVLRLGGLIQNDGVHLAVQAFRKVAEDGANGDFPMHRFGAARLGLAREFGLSQQAMRDVVAWLSAPLVRGQGWEALTEYGERLAAVTPEDMTELLKPCPGTQIISLEGPESVITRVLDEAGIVYEVVDWEQRALAALETLHRPTARKYAKRLEEKAEKKAKEAAESDDDDKADAAALR